MSNWRLPVYERDGWQCQMPRCLCPSGRAIDPGLRGTYDPWAPSIDHVVWRSMRGSNRLENLRAAHRQCNMSDAGNPGPKERPRPSRPAAHLSYKIGDLFPGDQGSRWS